MKTFYLRMGVALVPALFAAAVAHAQGSGNPVGFTRVHEADAFAGLFCDSSRDSAHVFMLPLATFEHGGSIECDFGTYDMRMVEPADDPGHVVLNIDPPDGVGDGFDCDAKADIGMQSVALNCLPANAEAVDHRKP